MSNKKRTMPTRGRYLAAMVLGTAVAALGPSSPAAAQEVTPRAVEDISRYCTACWRNARLPADRWNDCTQEVLCRLLRTVHPGNWTQVLANEGEDRKEFIRAIDAVKKRTQRERRRSTLVDDAVADQRGAHEATNLEARQAMLEAARGLVSMRQQRILELTCDGWSVAEIASALSAHPQRVSDEKYKAIQKLRQHFEEA